MVNLYKVELYAADLVENSNIDVFLNSLYCTGGFGIFITDKQTVKLSDEQWDEFKDLPNKVGYEKHFVKESITLELIAALKLAKDMMIANDLSLPNTFGVIDAVLDKTKNL